MAHNFCKRFHAAGKERKSHRSWLHLFIIIAKLQIFQHAFIAELKYYKSPRSAARLKLKLFVFESDMLDKIYNYCPIGIKNARFFDLKLKMGEIGLRVF